MKVPRAVLTAWTVRSVGFEYNRHPRALTFEGPMICHQNLWKFNAQNDHSLEALLQSISLKPVA
jgi:hypothetical protein